MQASENCYAIIKRFEGLHDGNPKTTLLEPMLDPIGIPTVGYGITHYEDGTSVTLDDKPITPERSDQLLHYYVEQNTAFVLNVVKVPLTQNQLDALVSLVHNIGKGNFGKSTLLAKLNSKCYSCAADQFLVWNKGGSRVLPGLVSRRHEERILFLS